MLTPSRVFDTLVLGGEKHVYNQLLATAVDNDDHDDDDDRERY